MGAIELWAADVTGDDGVVDARCRGVGVAFVLEKVERVSQAQVGHVGSLRADVLIGGILCYGYFIIA